MLQDYEIKRTGRKTEKLVSFIEFVLILVILQAAIMLISGGQNEEVVQFRLLAHSNATSDQLVKEEIQHAISPLIDNAVTISSSPDEMDENLAAIETEIMDIARSIAKQSITLERKDAIIPPKRSGFVIQPQATYDAYILTIGSGRGDNWWCSLFPNICFPEEEAKEEKVETETTTFFLWEWIKGLFS